MSSIQVKVPVLPESVRDATIATWHKKPGDQIKRDENLVDLETDKVVLEVPAPCDGILADVLKPEGSTVLAEEVLANITAGELVAVTKKQEDNKINDVKTGANSGPNSGPSARRAASEAGVILEAIEQGSGVDGRVTKQDVLKAQANQPNQSIQSKQVSNAGSQAVQVALGERQEKRVPMTRLRAKIAQRLVESQQTAAILTTFNEINMKPVMDLRSRYKDEFEKAHGIRLGFMSFFVKACVEALKRFPAVNASIDGSDIVYHGYFDIGVAVSSDRGLVVPIVRDADKKSMGELESEIRNFGERAQKGQLSIEEMTGGTFTVSNGGVFGSLLSTPIINPPQSAILGMHKIEDRPVVENGQIVIRPMMYVALSYDHRIIDGKESVSFLRTIKELLEDPNRILLEV